MGSVVCGARNVNHIQIVKLGYGSKKVAASRILTLRAGAIYRQLQGTKSVAGSTPFVLWELLGGCWPHH